MSTEDDETMVQFLFGNSTFTNELHQDPIFKIPSMHWSDHDMVSPYYFSNDVSSSMYYWPHVGTTTSSSTTSHFVPHSDIESYYLNDPNAESDFCLGEEKNSEITCFLEETSNGDPENAAGNQLDSITPSDHKSPPKRRLQLPELDRTTMHGKEQNLNVGSKKKARASIDKPKEGQKSIKNAESEVGGPSLTRQTSGCYSSEDDSSGSQEINGGRASSSSKASTAKNGKTRASRGSASDPQSLYARRRRERINERLRILQNLVPNGTKVDISTMLEEAVQYVKFLQLQIKLLSSEDMWMYAPIAYNGMDIGLDLKISPPQ